MSDDQDPKKPFQGVVWPDGVADCDLRGVDLVGPKVLICHHTGPLGLCLYPRHPVAGVPLVFAAVRVHRWLWPQERRALPVDGKDNLGATDLARERCCHLRHDDVGRVAGVHIQ